jgi:prolyl oligopeptidase
VISAANSTYGNELYIKDLTVENSPIVTIVDNFNSDNIIDSEGSKLFIETDLNAPTHCNRGCS